MSSFEKLEETAARAEAKAADARRRAEQAQVAALERYEARFEQWDRQVLERYDEEQLRRAQRDAYARFEQSVASSELFRAWVDYRAAVEIHMSRATEAANIAERTGSDKRVHVPGWGAVDLIGSLEQALSKAVGARVADDMDRRAEEREGYAAQES